MNFIRSYAINLCTGLIFGMVMMFFGAAILITGAGYCFASVLGMTSAEADMEDVEKWRKSKGKPDGPWGPIP